MDTNIFSAFKRPLPPKIPPRKLGPAAGSTLRRPWSTSSAASPNGGRGGILFNQKETVVLPSWEDQQQQEQRGIRRPPSSSSSTWKIPPFRPNSAGIPLIPPQSPRARGRTRDVVGGGATPSSSSSTFKTKMFSSQVVTRESVGSYSRQQPLDPFSELQNMPGFAFNNNTPALNHRPDLNPNRGNSNGNFLLPPPTFIPVPPEPSRFLSPRPTFSPQPTTTGDADETIKPSDSVSVTYLPSVNKPSSSLFKFGGGSTIIKGLRVIRRGPQDRSSSTSDRSVSDPEITRRYSIAELVDIISGEKPIPEPGMFTDGPLRQRYLAEDRARQQQTTFCNLPNEDAFIGIPSSTFAFEENDANTSSYFGSSDANLFSGSNSNSIDGQAFFQTDAQQQAFPDEFLSHSHDLFDETLPFSAMGIGSLGTEFVNPSQSESQPSHENYF